MIILRRVVRRPPPPNFRLLLDKAKVKGQRQPQKGLSAVLKTWIKEERKNGKMEDNRYYKTVILQLMAGEYYEFYEESELAEMFQLKDSDFTKELYEKKLAEHREMEECYYND